MTVSLGIRLKRHEVYSFIRYSTVVPVRLWIHVRLNIRLERGTPSHMWKVSHGRLFRTDTEVGLE